MDASGVCPQPSAQRVAWKELRASQFSLRGGLLILIISLCVFGIVFPLQDGPGWETSRAALLTALWLPIFLTNGTVVDSFAGERERKTLESLLASRLSDRAILFGKIGAAISYGWGLVLISASLTIIAVNIAFGHEPVRLYSPVIGLGIVVLSLLGAGFAAGSGVLVSLRASTVRQAYQQLSLGSIIVPALLFFGSQALPDEWKVPLTQTLLTASTEQIVVGAAVILLIVDAGLFAVAMARFQRARLILD
jgi:ABC-2 type transport system permease protein